MCHINQHACRPWTLTRLLDCKLWVDKTDRVSLIWIWRALVKHTGFSDLGFYLFFYLYSQTRASVASLKEYIGLERSLGVLLFESTSAIIWNDERMIQWYFFSGCDAHLPDRHWPWIACSSDYCGKLIELDLFILKNVDNKLWIIFFLSFNIFNFYLNSSIVWRT